MITVYEWRQTGKKELVLQGQYAADTYMHAQWLVELLKNTGSCKKHKTVFVIGDDK